MSLPDAWRTVEGDHARTYPCERYVAGGRRLLRAVDVAAPPPVVYRWVCQVRVAPYSYDLVDNLGRRSPRRLLPGLDMLEVGQRFAGVFRIVELARDEQVTALVVPGARRAFGPVALTYHVRPAPAGTRLVGALSVGASGPAGRLRREVLAWGDLVMMRKQLLTLRRLAEQTAREALRTSRDGPPATTS